MHKKSVSMFVVLLLVLSPLRLAQANETDSCSGFLNSIKCFFFGDASKRPIAGSAWYDRGVSLPWYEPEGRALAGEPTRFVTCKGGYSYTNYHNGECLSLDEWINLYQEGLISDELISDV